MRLKQAPCNVEGQQVCTPWREAFASGDLVSSGCLIASHKISRHGGCEPSSMKQTLGSGFAVTNACLDGDEGALR